MRHENDSNCSYDRDFKAYTNSYTTNDFNKNELLISSSLTTCSDTMIKGA